MKVKKRLGYISWLKYALSGGVLMGIIATGFARSNIIYKLDLVPQKTTNTLTLQAQQRLVCRHFSLGKPSRLVIDCRHSQLSKKINQKQWQDVLVKRLRHSLSKQGNLRVVLDLQCRSKVTVVDTENKNTLRYVLKPLCDRTVLKRAGNVKKSKITHKVTANIKQKNKKIKSPVIKKSALMTTSARPIMVVIDPGHGGKDPGATSRNGVHEKNVVLKISRYIQRDLDKKLGFKAVLTRHGDYYLTLRQRLRVARRYHPDMFVAIHADAFHNRRARGASVFALSQRGATSEAARWLARRENHSELMGGADLADKSHLLRSVLINLSQSASIAASIQVGNSIKKNLARITPLHQKRVEQAAFVVLKSPDIPSLLIETGFLSNAREARLLNTASYQRKVAAAIARGTINYFSKYPPHGSLLALQKHGLLTYKVKRGDSLIAISKRYTVNVSILKKFNKITGSNIRVGQILHIPKQHI